MVSATNQARRKMATLIQEDLARVGIRVRLQPIEFGVMTDAVLKTRKFEGALWGIASGDADPNSEMNVWTSGGTLHVWNLKSGAGAQPPRSVGNRGRPSDGGPDDARLQARAENRVRQGSTARHRQRAGRVPRQPPRPRRRRPQSRQLRASRDGSGAAVERRSSVLAEAEVMKAMKARSRSRARDRSLERLEPHATSALRHRLRGRPTRPTRGSCGQCLEGDKEAWSTLLDRYKRLIYSIPVKYGLSDRRGDRRLSRRLRRVACGAATTARAAGAAEMAGSGDVAQMRALETAGEPASLRPPIAPMRSTTLPIPPISATGAPRGRARTGACETR